MIIKGPGVQQRTRVIPHSLPQEAFRFGSGQPNGAGAGTAAAERVERPEDVLEQARDARQRAERELTEALARADQVRSAAEAEAARIVARATAEAERLLAQGQVDLGRAQAEAERLFSAAQARLDEVSEIIPTAAEARQLLAESREEAERLLAKAEAERQQVYDDAHAQGLAAGREAGYAEGTQQAREELAQALEHAHAVAAGARVDREALIAAAEPEIVRLAMEVARKLIAREVSVDGDILKGMLTRAMLKAAGDGPIRLRLHPETIEVLGSYLADVSDRFRARGVEVVSDPSAGVAGVVVDTRSGTVDARIETQLDKVERTLLALTGE